MKKEGNKYHFITNKQIYITLEIYNINMENNASEKLLGKQWNENENSDGLIKKSTAKVNTWSKFVSWILIVTNYSKSIKFPINSVNKFNKSIVSWNPG